MSNNITKGNNTSVKLYFTLFLVQFIVCLPSLVQAQQISSNHSYIKNSTFTTDHNIEISGYGNFRLDYSSFQKKNSDGSTDSSSKNAKTTSENEISVDIHLQKEIDELTKIGIHYIPYIDNKYTSVMNRYYGYIDSYYGRIEFGNTTSVFNNMKVGADTIALGSGGMGGNFARTITLQSDYAFLLYPNSLLNQNFGYMNSSLDIDMWEDTRYLTKVNFYTPEFFGFQLAVGITPNTKLKKEYLNTDNISITDDVDTGMFLDFGVSYINTFDNLGIAISAVGEKNISNSSNKTDGVKEDIQNNFTSAELGVNVNYFGLTLAGSIGNVKIDIDTTNNANIYSAYPIKKGTYLTYGFAYELESISLSVTRFEGKYKDYTKFVSTSFALEKNITKGVSIYGEYTSYTSSILNDTTQPKYKGDIAMVGVVLKFE